MSNSNKIYKSDISTILSEFEKIWNGKCIITYTNTSMPPTKIYKLDNSTILSEFEKICLEKCIIAYTNTSMPPTKKNGIGYDKYSGVYIALENGVCICSNNIENDVYYCVTDFESNGTYRTEIIFQSYNDALEYLNNN